MGKYNGIDWMAISREGLDKPIEEWGRYSRELLPEFTGLRFVGFGTFSGFPERMTQTRVKGLAIVANLAWIAAHVGCSMATARKHYMQAVISTDNPLTTLDAATVAWSDKVLQYTDVVFSGTSRGKYLARVHKDNSRTLEKLRN